MSYMREEIYQQPEVISSIVANEREAAAEVAGEILKRDVSFIVIAARGTSDHAAIYGKYLLEIANGFPVGLADPSVFTLYKSELRMDQALVIGISQSGEAADVAEYLEQSRKFGALTLGITNEAGSTLTRVADHVIFCNAGKEYGVAATKTYTSTLAALYMLSAFLNRDESRLDKLLACAEAMKTVLAIEEYIAMKAERYRYMREGHVISRGLNLCTALETALKMAETSYVALKAYSAADFLHGPIAAVDEGEPCFICAPPGKAFEAMLDVTRRLKEIGAENVILSSEDDILSLARTPVKIDVRVDEELSPLVYIIPGQLLSYHLAVTRGHDPDRPRGLSKVTVTR